MMFVEFNKHDPNSPIKYDPYNSYVYYVDGIYYDIGDMEHNLRDFKLWIKNCLNNSEKTSVDNVFENLVDSIKKKNLKDDVSIVTEDNTILKFSIVEYYCKYPSIR